MTDIVQGLFGANPQELAMQRQAALQAQGNAYAAQDPFARASSLLYQGGQGLGNAIGGMLGGQDPQMVTAAKIAAIVKNGDQTTAEGMMAIAKQFAAEGLSGPAALAQQKAQEMQLGQAKVANEQAQTAKYAAETGKVEYGMKQDMALRDALTKLGPDASETDIVRTVAQYGSPDKVLAVVQNAQDKRAARDLALAQSQKTADAKVEAAQIAADAKVEAAKVAADAARERAKEQGATKLQLAEMTKNTNIMLARIGAEGKAAVAAAQIEGRNQLAQLTASLKGPSPAELKAAEKKQQLEEGQANLQETVTTVRNTITKLAEAGAIPSTKSSPISNLFTSTQNTGVGQYLGQTFGTENQANRDVLSSLQLQMLNAVKSATGMSSTQLNSNMELQTWLNSLGNTKSTAEARLKIIDNIENAYLKKGSKMDKTPETPPAATGEWSIKLKAK